MCTCVYMAAKYPGVVRLGMKPRVTRGQAPSRPAAASPVRLSPKDEHIFRDLMERFGARDGGRRDDREKRLDRAPGVRESLPRDPGDDLPQEGRRRERARHDPGGLHEAGNGPEAPGARIGGT